MALTSFPLVYEIAGQRRCYLATPGMNLVVGSGAGCEVRLEADGVREVEATLKILGECSVRLTIPGEGDVEEVFPLHMNIGGYELVFFRPVDMHGRSDSSGGMKAGCEITISTGGSTPLRRRIESSSPLLFGRDVACGAIVPGDECPGVAVAVWWRGDACVLVQVLDNSAPVEWENRADAFEGEMVLPLTLSIAGKLISLKIASDSQNMLLPVEQVRPKPSSQHLIEQGANGAKKSSLLIGAGLGALIMLLIAGIIYFLMPTKNISSQMVATQLVADAATPMAEHRETAKSQSLPIEAASDRTKPVPTATVQAPQTPTISTTAPAPKSSVETPKGPTTVAVLEFENIGGGEEAEPLRKGLREMMVTDLSGISMLKIVERARLDDLLKELALSEGKFIDQTTAQKLGKGLSAQAVLTGSYTVFGNELRMDVKLVRVETGEIILAEKTSGPKDTFFSIQQELAKKLVAGLNIELGDAQRVALSTPQTKSYAAFNFYSKGLLASSTGDLQRAEMALRQALSEDRNFKLADRALEELKKRAAANIERISSTQMTRQKEALSLADQLLEQMADHAAANRQIASEKHYDAKYFKSLIVLATHAELNRQPNVADEIFQGFVNDLLLHTQPGEFFKLQKAIASLLNEDRQVFLKTAFAPNPNARSPKAGTNTDSMFPLLRLHDPKLFDQGFWGVGDLQEGVSFDLPELLEKRVSSSSNIRQSIERRLRLYEFANLHPEHVKLARYTKLREGFGDDYREMKDLEKTLVARLGEAEVRYFSNLLRYHYDYRATADADSVIREWDEDSQLRDVNFLKALVFHVQSHVDKAELYIKNYRSKGDEQEARKGEYFLKSSSESLLGLLRCIDGVGSKHAQIEQASGDGTSKAIRHWKLKSGREFEGRFEMSDGNRLVVAVKAGEEELFAVGDLNQQDLDFVKQCAEAVGTWNNDYHVWDSEFGEERSSSRFSIGKIVRVEGLNEGDSKENNVVPQVMVQGDNLVGICLEDLSKDDLEYINQWRRRSKSQ